jgi:hypothetical protein
MQAPVLTHHLVCSIQPRMDCGIPHSRWRCCRPSPRRQRRCQGLLHQQQFRCADQWVQHQGVALHQGEGQPPLPLRQDILFSGITDGNGWSSLLLPLLLPQDILFSGITGGNAVVNGRGEDLAIDFGGVAPSAAYANLLTNLTVGQVRRRPVPPTQQGAHAVAADRAPARQPASPLHGQPAQGLCVPTWAAAGEASRVAGRGCGLWVQHARPCTFIKGACYRQRPLPLCCWQTGRQLAEPTTRMNMPVCL